MGLIISLTLPSHFSKLRRWKWASVENTLKLFFESNFSIGLDITGVVFITSFDLKLGKSLISALSQNDTRIINANILLAVIILLADADVSIEEQRISAAFDLFDYGGGVVSKSELTVLLYTFEYATICILGKPKSLDLLDAKAAMLRASKKSSYIYQKLGKESSASVTKSEFIIWVQSSLDSILTGRDVARLQTWITADYDIPAPSFQSLEQHPMPPDNQEEEHDDLEDDVHESEGDDEDDDNHSENPSPSIDSLEEVNLLTPRPIVDDDMSMHSLRKDKKDKLVQMQANLSCSDSGVPILTAQHTSIVAGLLRDDPSLYTDLSALKTTSGFTIDPLIQAAIDCPDISVGCVFGDEHCYETFSPMYDSVIHCLHNNFSPDDSHKTDLNPDHVSFDGIDPKYVRSCNVRAHRNICGFRFPPFASRRERRLIEQIFQDVAEALEGTEFAGKYYPIDSTDESLERRLLFSKPTSENSRHEAFDCGKDWPDARGIFYNAAMQVVVWVNDEDHLKVISMEKGCDVESAYLRWCRLASVLESHFNNKGYKLAHSPHLGYLSTCPSKLGTGIRCGVSVKLPLLSQYEQVFSPICFKLGLSYIPPSGSSGWCDVSNSGRLGASEAELMQTVVIGIRTLIGMEKALEKNDKDGYKVLLATLPEEFVHPRIYSNYVANAAYSADREEEWRAKHLSDLNKTDDFPVISLAHSSLLCRTLTRIAYETSAALLTPTGFSLQQAISPGIEYPTAEVGLVAGDEYCYSLFEGVYRPVIGLIHGDGCVHRSLTADQRNAADITIPSTFDTACVKACAIAMSRNLGGYAFCGGMRRGERRDVEKVILRALAGLSDELKGDYHAMASLEQKTESELNILKGRNVVVDKPINTLFTFVHDWPDGRGVFLSDDSKVAVAVNCFDHIKVVISSSSLDIKSDVARALRIVELIEAALTADTKCFAYSEDLGFLTSCPSLLGTAMEISLTMDLPLFSISESARADLCKLHGIKFGKVDLTLPNNNWVCSRKAKIGLDEYSFINELFLELSSLVNVQSNRE